jgi:calcyclin binding protein
VYITSGVDGIGKHTKENIDCEFTDTGIDFRILNFNGKNYRLKISPLNDLIDPAASKFKVKSNSVTIDLVKKKSKHWSDIKQTKSLTKAADEIGKKKKGEDEENPNAGLMSMMKELYETGDENMKRTIAESWQKASENKMMGKV